MTYDYKCRKCDHRFSVDKPISEAGNPEICPECGGPGVKVYGAVSVHFRGEGFTCSCADGCESCERCGDGTG